MQLNIGFHIVLVTFLLFNSGKAGLRKFSFNTHVVFGKIRKNMGSILQGGKTANVLICKNICVQVRQSFERL